MSEKHVVIVENKDDDPLVLETYIGSASYDDAYKRMLQVKAHPETVRVAMAKLEFVAGNRSLLRD